MHCLGSNLISKKALKFALKHFASSKTPDSFNDRIWDVTRAKE